MRMEVRRIDSSAVWEKFLRRQPYTLFVQSWHHGEFYRTLGEDFWVMGVYDDDDALVGGSLILSIHAKRGNFLYLPYGPVFTGQNKESAWAVFTKALVDLAKIERYDFIRISPFIDNTPSSKTTVQAHGFRLAPMHMLAEHTWLLDIQKSEEEILSNMNKNHRNLIRRCEREGVRVEMHTELSAINIFNDLHDVTVDRHKFHRYSRKYIANQFSILSPHSEAEAFLSYLPNGTLDSAAVIIFYGSMAAYYHGASLGRDKRLPTSYLLQWRAIQEAKKRKMVWYNFWGVAPEDAPATHPFAGITHFKKGFGGYQKNLLPAHDYPVTARYWLNWGIETLRKRKRGFV